MSATSTLRQAAARIAALPSLTLFPLIFIAVALSHLTLLHLPYFWDEGGYYIPAAFDFYHHGWLVPHFTNAHPPLPNILIGSLWHIVGVHIAATRLLVAAFAAAALLAVFRLTQRLLDAPSALAVTLLLAVYPIFFTQSTLAHADIFSAAFTLWAFALYLPKEQGLGIREQGTGVRKGVPTAAAPEPETESLLPNPYSLIPVSLLFSLAVLSKETAIFQPAALATLQLFFLIRDRKHPTLRREHLHWLLALATPLLPLLAWYGYHHHVTGFTFGNPEYLRYNATANLTAAHLSQAIRYRFLHLFWQRNIWLPILLAIACLFLQHRVPDSANNQAPPANSNNQAPPASADNRAIQASSENQVPRGFSLGSHIPLEKKVGALAPTTRLTLAILILANWIGFSILGGALLTRYLLPIYPLILLLCVDIWRSRTAWWPALAALTFAAFLSALWINPPTSFAPEDNLTYRDMIVAHQLAIDYVAQHYPDATVLTAWPVAADLFRPELGYVTQPLKAHSIEDFTRPSILKAAQQPGDYDTAIVFTTHFTTPSFRRWLLAHPTTARGREFAATRDLTPAEIAALLGGRIVFQTDQRGEWAAVLRFPRTYDASLSTTLPHPRP